ncbi:MAG: hypothetical protein ACRDD7_16795 [Peptostreptococcaceae bacterium]
MSINDVVLGLILGLTFWVGIFLGIFVQEHDCKYHNYPSDMRFYMYCEKCTECGYKEKEVEYSIVSNLGHSFCNQCLSSYEFEYNDKGEKVIINEN